MKKRILFAAIIVIVVGVIGWRFWPCAATALGVPKAEPVIVLSAYGMISEFENGQTSHVYYRMETQETPQIQEVLGILNTSHYRQDFRNLWPCGTDSVGSDKNYDSRTVSVDLLMGDAYFKMQFMSPSIVAVSSSEWSGYRIYHPTNRQTMDALIEYLQTHGTIQ